MKDAIDRNRREAHGRSKKEMRPLSSHGRRPRGGRRKLRRRGEEDEEDEEDEQREREREKEGKLRSRAELTVSGVQKSKPPMDLWRVE